MRLNFNKSFLLGAPASGYRPETLAYRAYCDENGFELYSLWAVERAYRELAAMGVSEGLVAADLFGRKIIAGRTAEYANLFDKALNPAQVTEANRPRALGRLSFEQHVWLPGESGNYISTPDSAANSVLGDMDLRVEVAADDWSAPGYRTFISKRGSAGNAAFGFRLNNSKVELYWTEDGSTFIVAASSVVTGISAGKKQWVRATIDVDNGSGGNDVAFYLSGDGSTWTQLGSTVTTAGVTSIYDSSAAIEIGSHGAGSAYFFAGEIYSAEIRDGIDGTVVASFDASLSGQDGYTDATNATVWTIHRSAGGMKSELVDRPMSLYGTDRYMEVANTPLLDMGLADSFTLALGQRYHATPAGFSAAASNRASGATNAGYTAQTASGSPYIYGSVADGTSAIADTAGMIDMTGIAGLCGLVLDRATETLKSIQSDGALTAGASITGYGSLSTANGFRIGRRGGTETAYMDNVVFGLLVAKQVLTAAQLTTLRTILGADE